MQFLHSVQIKLLLTFSPARFFHKINELDWYKKNLRDWFDDNLTRPNLQVLELACETGSLTTYIHDQGHRVTGVDLSSKMIAYAQKSHPHIKFHKADAANLPFDDNSFDIVLAASLINIAPSAPQIIKEMARICKKRGIIKILVPAKGFDANKLEKLIDQLGISGFSEEALRAWHKYPPKMSINDIETLLEKSKLTIASQQYYLNKMLISVCIVND